LVPQPAIVAQLRNPKNQKALESGEEVYIIPEVVGTPLGLREYEEKRKAHKAARVGLAAVEHIRVAGRGGAANYRLGQQANANVVQQGFVDALTHILQETADVGLATAMRIAESYARAVAGLGLHALLPAGDLIAQNTRMPTLAANKADDNYKALVENKAALRETGIFVGQGSDCRSPTPKAATSRFPCHNT